MESALFAAGEQFAQEARERSLRRDEFGYAWDVRDVCADGERGDGEWAERRWHWGLFEWCGRRLGVDGRAVLTSPGRALVVSRGIGITANDPDHKP